MICMTISMIYMTSFSSAQAQGTVPPLHRERFLLRAQEHLGMPAGAIQGNNAEEEPFLGVGTACAAKNVPKLMNTDGAKTAQIVDSDILTVTSDFLAHARETISY